MEASQQTYLLQDSRSTVGTNLQFWAESGGYTTNIEKAERFTQEKAFAQHQGRRTDIPIPLEYIQARTRRVVDMQYVKPADVVGMADAYYYLQQVPNDWDGNDIVFIAAAGRARTTDLAKAKLVPHAHLESLPGPHIPWPQSYIDGKSRLSISGSMVNMQEALKDTGMVLTPEPKPRKETYRCHACGRFLSIGDYYSCSGCPHCKADNRP